MQHTLLLNASVLCIHLVVPYVFLCKVGTGAVAAVRTGRKSESERRKRERGGGEKKNREVEVGGIVYI